MFRIIPRININFGWEEIVSIFKSFIKRQLVYGPHIDEFQSHFSKYVGVKNAIFTTSARDSLFIILKALEFEEGSEIILPSYSFFAIPEVIKKCKLLPKFTDINPETYNINPYIIENQICGKTKAILVEHLFGQPCEMAPILEIARKYNLLVIEDCAQSCGSEYKGKKVGTIGDVGYFSFAYGKNMTCFGGGMITTNNNDLALKIRNIVYNGTPMSKSEILKAIFWGLIQFILTIRIFYSIFVFPLFFILNLIDRDLIDILFEENPNKKRIAFSKIKIPSNVQAAIGIKQLKKLNDLNKKRIVNSYLLNQELGNSKFIKIQKLIPHVKHTYNCYVIQVAEPKILSKKLLQRGIDVRKDWMSLYNNGKSTSLPLTNIYLPNHPGLNKNDMLYIAYHVKSLCSKHDI